MYIYVVIVFFQHCTTLDQKFALLDSLLWHGRRRWIKLCCRGIAADISLPLIHTSS